MALIDPHLLDQEAQVYLEVQETLVIQVFPLPPFHL